MANFGELVLVLGDIDIPHRSNAIPEKFKRMLVPNKMQHVICTGNIGEQYDELRELAPNLHIVAGDFDYPSMECSSNSNKFPETRVVQVGNFRIGVVHGHQIIPCNNHTSIAQMRRKLNVDIIITGNSHQNEVVEHEGYYHINPGSITGSYTPLCKVPNGVTPSFILLAVQGSKVVCYVYELVNGEVEVSKTDFTKNE